MVLFLILLLRNKITFKCSAIYAAEQWFKYNIWGPGTVNSLGPQITAGAPGLL
jgi:hypothetical protein